jgi:hypothetical protein
MLANCLNFDAYIAIKHDFWQKRSYLNARCVFFVRVSKSGIELFKKGFKFIEQGWLMFQQECKPSKGHVLQQSANESNLD